MPARTVAASVSSSSLRKANKGTSPGNPVSPTSSTMVGDIVRQVRAIGAGPITLGILATGTRCRARSCHVRTPRSPDPSRGDHPIERAPRQHQHVAAKDLDEFLNGGAERP